MSGTFRLFVVGSVAMLLPTVLSLPRGQALGGEKLRIVTLGDSITKGVRTGVTADETFAALVEAGLREKQLNVEVVNLGIGGERTDQSLVRLAEAVIALKPLVVTVMYGTNDSYVDPGAKTSRLTADEYEENLRHIVAQLREAGIRPVLMTPPAWGAKARDGLDESPNGRLAEFVERCRTVAQETETPLVDHFAYWSKQADAGVDIGGWTTDQCHPNPQGHKIISESMLPVLADVLQSK